MKYKKNLVYNSPSYSVSVSNDIYRTSILTPKNCNVFVCNRFKGHRALDAITTLPESEFKCIISFVIFINL